MAYLKDVKLCIDCQFYGTPQGQRDRCLHPNLTGMSPVDGTETYPYCFAQRQSHVVGHCGYKAVFFVLNEEATLERDKKRQEFEEACRDSPL